NHDAIQNLLTQANQALARGDNTEACSKYRMVLSVDPQNVSARAGLGEGALGEGDYATARTHFQAVLDAAPDDPAALEGAGPGREWGGRTRGPPARCCGTACRPTRRCGAAGTRWA